MRNDVFTETILKIRRANGSELVIDKYTGVVIGRSFFKGKSVGYIRGYFFEAGGVCGKKEDGSEILLCELDRKWNYKNIGAYSDPDFWCVPGMSLFYMFQFSGEVGAEGTWSDLKFDAKDSGECPFRGK